jgi:hypothetical protein
VHSALENRLAGGERVVRAVGQDCSRLDALGNGRREHETIALAAPVGATKLASACVSGPGSGVKSTRFQPTPFGSWRMPAT